MFNRKKSVEDPKLQKAIDDALDSLDRCMPEEEKYAAIVKQLTALYALKPKPDRVSKEAAATIAANLFGILVIVGHERAHVVTSKALGFVQKLR